MYSDGFGGLNPTVTNSCLQFHTKNCDWKEVGRMNEPRFCSACAVFEERIVVSGGKDSGYNKLRTVESYDVIADEWSPMPDMINGKSSHSLVVVKNKLFVIGNRQDSCEVFDSICKKFVMLNSPQLNAPYLQAVPIRNKVVVFQYKTPLVKCYDVDKTEWSDEACEVAKNVIYFSCVKLPRY